ncbi:AsmA-like C-terminal region-containing protein [Roseicyclus persicicus]|uniref:YhdP central domain-containing protein n=1 Tax=Roseicyclus persicicus TaxID=2650661 RepID=A0A7X6H1M5_9RHOB|nr:AsmA-like C-terminal region-containing protein [Roseibacterium persicicum]NKX46397.1 hypothetical protein [Roseibacterium persicicum]
MTADRQATPDGAPPGARPPRRRRRGRVALLLLALGLLLLPALAAGALYVRLGGTPLALPGPIADRIEARLDAAMAANRVEIGTIEISRPEGTVELGLTLRDLRLSDPDGAPRAAFPALSVELSTAALLQGRVHPLRVDLAGAGLRLARDASGQIDLALIAGGAASELSLAETLARLDTMFASPAFAELEGVTGTGLQLVMEDAMTGQVMRVREARMRLERKDGVLSLSLGGALEGSRAATLDIALTRDAGTGTANLGFAFSGVAARDVATIGPALAWVDLMRAPISGFLGGALMEDGSVGDLRVSLDIGPGQLRVDGAETPLGFDRVAAALRYDATSGRITFDSLALSAPQLGFDATGHADASPDGSRYTAQFRLSDITLAPGELFPAPLSLDGGALDLRLTLAPRLEIEIGQAALFDDGLALSAHGRLWGTEAGLALSLDASLPEAGAAQVLAYWPEAAIPATRTWLARNLPAARLHGVDVAVRAAPGQAPEVALDLDFTEAELVALAALPPITGAAGYVSLVGPRLVLRLDEGQIAAPGGAAVALDGSTMTVANTRVPGPEAELDLVVAGELTDLLTLLQAPPVRLMQGSAMTPARIGTGAAEMHATIVTRLMRQEGMGDTRFEVAGTVRGFASDTLVPGRSLAAEALQVAVTPEAVRISGRASFDGVPVTGSWSRPLGPGAAPAARVEARTGLTRERLADLGLPLPAWLMSGQAEAALVLDLPDGAAPVLQVTSDLSGAALALPPLGWRLTQGQTGRLDAVIRLGPAPEVTRLALEAGGLTLEGRVSLRPGGGFDRLTADRFRLGRWLDVTGALIGRGGGRPPAVEVTGGTLDLRGAAPAGRGGGGAGAGVPITATLDRLQVTEGIALTALLAELTTDGGLSGQFRARVNGEAPITGTLVATEAGPAVRIRAEDGGAVLRSAGVFRSAYGGAMELVLRATGAEGTYDGTLSIDSPRLRDAPAMAELLNLISVVGLLEQLSEEGINLGTVDARFRITPTQLILQEGVAFGASLGVSMDGTYALATRQLDMAGVISPLNAVNSLFGAIFSPRREGLFGFAYRLTGPSDNPQVAVNPLSILTPGVFREIFRRPPPNLD